MRKALLSQAILAAALLPGGFAVSADTVDLGYQPTINKKTAKRLKRKAARRSNAPKGAAKPHNQRNKKGRP